MNYKVVGESSDKAERVLVNILVSRHLLAFCSFQGRWRE